MMMNGSSSFGLLLALAMLAVLAVVVVGGVRLYHRLAAPRPHRTALPHTALLHTALSRTATPSGDPALIRLRERYAAGEIDDEEYERRLSALTYWS
jgi:uncharacterized membrane protein